MRAFGKDVIGFGAGQPDFDTPEHIKQAAIEALLAGKTKYAPTPGVPEAREAVARKLREENAIECRADDVVITVGAKQALYMTLQATVDPGREVLLPSPCWVSYRPMVELAGGIPIEIAGAMANDFKITPGQLEQALSDRTAAIMINSPSNPCGTMYSRDELAGLADVLARHPQVVVITDEIYEKLTYGGLQHVSLGAFPELADRVVTINGLSKAYAMTGWRVGYLCAPGRDGAVAKAAARLQSQMTSNITSFLYAALIEALENGAEDAERMRQVFAKRAELMHDAVTRMPGLCCPKPTGAFYLFPDISVYFGRRSPGGMEITSAVDFAEALLEETLVAVVPGEDFGECARTHVRLSFACSDEEIEIGCRRMHDWLEGFEGG